MRRLWLGLLAVLVSLLVFGVAVSADARPTKKPHPSPSPTPTQTVTPTPTPTPTPTATTVSPTPTATVTSTVPAGSFPDASNTGVPSGTTLTPTGSMTITTANTVVDGKLINGCVDVRATGVTIKNSRIVGNGCFMVVLSYSAGLTLSDVEITCGDMPNTAVSGSFFTLSRADIAGCENGLDIDNSSTMTDSWIHDLYFAGDAHTDGVQVNQSASNVTFRHNTIQAPQPGGVSAINIWNEGDPQAHDVLVENNRLLGGVWTIYCPRQTASNIRILNNRIGDWTYGPQDACEDETEFVGNVNDATGAPIS